jgi:hypothetical protein
VPSSSFFDFFYGVFVPLDQDQQGEFKNTTKNFLGKVHVKNFLPKKMRGKNLFPVVFSLRFFYRVFYCFSA